VLVYVTHTNTVSKKEERKHNREMCTVAVTISTLHGNYGINTLVSISERVCVSKVFKNRRLKLLLYTKLLLLLLLLVCFIINVFLRGSGW